MVKGDCELRSKMLNAKIGIVGAGISGLAACWKLKNMGFGNITVFEGSNRIGGRINSVPFDNGILELGAQWVHGEEGNLVYEFAQGKNLLSNPKKDYSVEGKGHFLTSQGKFVEEILVKEAIMALDGISENVVTKYENVEGVEGVPLGKIFEQCFLEYLNSCLGDSDEIKNIKKGIYYWYLRFLIIDNCCDSLEDLSIAGTNEWIDCPGVPLINFKNGFSTLVDTLLNEIEFRKSEEELDKPVLRLNKGVKQINWSFGSNTNTRVELILSDETIAQFNHVIVTSSVGFLKENIGTFFNPQLPEEKIKVLQSIGFGTVNKIYLIFDKPFWNSTDLGFQLVWLENNLKIDVAPWAKGISGFDIVRAQPNVLVGWIGGEQAREVEQIDDNEVITVCISLLRHFLGRYDIQAPKSVIRSNWHSDPYIRGSYCHRSLGFEMLIEPVNKLCEPLCVTSKFGSSSSHETEVPVIFFAGEATHKWYFSSVHGAMQSGYREAEKIYLIYNNNEK